MTNNGYLHTCNEKHSLKEAIISFVVTPQIMDLSQYRELVETGGSLAADFQKFEPIKTMEVHVKAGLAESQRKEEYISGFKLIGFCNAKATNVIQGINQQPNIGLFTFNTVDYEGWTAFSTLALRNAETIAQVKSIYKVALFSVSFIDEFYFLKDKYNPAELFNKGSHNLPQGIFDSQLIDYNLSMNRQDEGRSYQEDLAIKVFDEVDKKTIRIIENITFGAGSVEFTKLLAQSQFRSDLNFIHSKNKSMLKDILTPTTSDLIKLDK